MATVGVRGLIHCSISIIASVAPVVVTHGRTCVLGTHYSGRRRLWAQTFICLRQLAFFFLVSFCRLILCKHDNVAVVCLLPPILTCVKPVFAG